MLILIRVVIIKHKIKLILWILILISMSAQIFAVDSLLLQYNGTGGVQPFGYTGNYEKGSAEFIVYKPININIIEYWIKKAGTPTNNILMHLYNVNASGHPTSKIATSSTIINGATITTSYVPYNFTFSNLNMTNKTYAIVLNVSGSFSTSNYYRMEDSGSGTFRHYSWDTTGTPDKWTIWDLTDEGHFRIYGSLTTNNLFYYNGTSYPIDNNSYNSNIINFTQTVTIVNNSVNCSLFINNKLNESVIYSNFTNKSYSFVLNYANKQFLTPIEINYSISCKSLINNNTYNTTTSTFYLDRVKPIITTNFNNLSVYFKNNLNVNINLTDDFYLHSINISIDDKQIYGNDSLSGTSYSLNFNYNISNLTAQLHNLSIRAADGHTANEIMDYKVSRGIFNNYLKYSWKNENKFIKISNNDGSIFDTFTTTKQKDRYVWDFEPSNLKNNYDFIIESSDKIRIINDESTYLKSWIIFDDKWMDFDLFSENSTININKLNDKSVKVTISNIKNPKKQSYHSIGDLNIIYMNYTFYKLNASVSYQNAVFEGSLTPHLLELELLNILTLNKSVALIWNNDQQTIFESNISDNIVDFDSNILVPSTNLTNISWIWYFNVSGYNFNITGNSQFIKMNITNCSAGNYIVLNYTIYDEGTKIISSNLNASIENYLILTTPNYASNKFNFTIKENDNNLLICLPNNTLNYSSWILDATTKYTYNGHVKEYHYIVNYNLTLTDIPKNIYLYDLQTSDSTSFYVTYQDENYLYIEGAIIDLLRQYVYENGDFTSVEHGLTDQNGQTILHFVNEDIVYKANVWINGQIVYTSTDFKALCQSAPCQINIRKPYNEGISISEYDNIIYSISSQTDFRNTKKIIFGFSTKDGTSINMKMNVTKTTYYDNETICSISKTLSSGTLTCTIPASFYNATYTVNIYNGNTFFGMTTYSDEISANDVFGKMGVFLAGIGYLLLAFMGIASGSVSIVLGIIGLISMALLNLIETGSFFGIASTFIWLIIAATILIWKYQKRRVS